MPINELDAFCIAMPAVLCPFTEADHLRFLSVIGHAAATQPAAVEYRTLGRGFATEPASAAIRRICSELAAETVDGTRLVNGKRVTPEAYIERWRTRLNEPVPLDRLELDKGLHAVAVFDWWHESAVAAQKARWINPPFGTFADLLLARQFTPAPPGYLTRLEIDLADINGARDAWWAEDYLSALNRATSLVDSRIELRAASTRVQPPPCYASQQRSAHAVANF